MNTSIITNIITAGASNLEHAQRKKIQTANSLSLISALVAIGVGSFFLIIFNQQTIFLGSVIETVAFLYAIYLNKIRRYEAALVAILFTYCLATLFFGIYLGPVINVPLMSVFMAGIVLLLFDRKIIRIICLTAIGLTLTAVYVNKFIALIKPVEFSPLGMIILETVVAATIPTLCIIMLTFYLKARKHTEIRLVHQNKILGDTNESKSAFIKELSHEIRNPLNVVYGISNLLTSEPANVNDPDYMLIEREALTAIHTGGRQVLDIINNSLDWARIEAGAPESIHDAPLNMSEWIRELMVVYKYMASKKSVHLELELATGVPKLILTDRVKLTKVLGNLVSNAIKFTREKTTIEVKIKSDDTLIYIEVKDEGPGLSSEKMNEVFEPFYRSRSDWEGTGLGLPIAKKMIGILSGDLKVDSEEDKGTTFTISFPYKLAGDAGELSYSVRKFGRFTDSRVLVIEDDKIQQVMYKFLLNKVGCEYEFAASVAEGVKMARQFQPHLILCDMRLPDGNGKDFLQQIRSMENMKDIPVVAVSGGAFDDELQAAAEAGFNSYLTKPVEFSVFYKQLECFLTLHIDI
ncbi:ATP-binding protein [Chitinophaga sp. MM2321]|uniref:ATP-binding response regulator n=1 Tax=Chitinophaga sp. MM2321 TaxID=3137178 RepID=UPI0032D5986F